MEFIEILTRQGAGCKRMVRSNFDVEVKIMRAPQIDFAACDHFWIGFITIPG
jgi:hypothetical protein